MIDPGRLALRALLVQALRRFFIERGYLEVDTPIRLPAPAPEAHIEPFPSGDWFLQTSPELCMKRLLAAGLPRIFQICKCFRQEERGDRHLPEFTLLEWYAAGQDYRFLMSECEDLLRALALALAGEEAGGLAKAGIDLAGRWQRLTVAEAFRRYAPCSMEEALATDSFDEILVSWIEPELGRGRPTFLVDYPVELAALARRKPENPALAERFELYINGLELANGFSELIDPMEQRQRFLADQQKIEAAGRKAAPLPEPFLLELARMPPSAGIALGLDRLVMLFAGAEAIDRVVAFPPEAL